MSLTGAYRTEHGTVLPAVTTEEMREMDYIAIHETGPNLYQMMENAGRTLAATVLSEVPADTEAPRIVVLAGTGGNGGGGICAARHLANRGLDVTLCISRPDNLAEVPAYQRWVYSGTNGAVVDVEHLASLRAEIVVDAIIGYGMTDAPHGPAGDMIQWARDQRSAFGARVLSLDVPSGVDATTGEAPGAHISADVTVTLALPKAGLHPDLGLDADIIGSLRLVDLGMPSALYARFGSPFPFTTGYLVDIDAVGYGRE
jgi:NAD(P)H-hydrate epimerase